jgi:hypothetical protein
LLDILDSPGTEQNAALPLVDSFVNSISSKIQPPLLAAPLAPTKTKPLSPPKTDDTGPRASGRLAAKPTARLSTIDKAKLVLLKKSGLEPDNSSLTDAVKHFDEIYKKPLPPAYINAVVSLVDTTMPGRKGRPAALEQVAAA